MRPVLIAITLVLVLLLVVYWARTGRGGSVCNSDSDCGGATPYCVDGVCRGCSSSADCAPGQYCSYAPDYECRPLPAVCYDWVEITPGAPVPADAAFVGGTGTTYYPAATTATDRGETWTYVGYYDNATPGFTGESAGEVPSPYYDVAGAIPTEPLYYLRANPGCSATPSSGRTPWLGFTVDGSPPTPVCSNYSTATNGYPGVLSSTDSDSLCSSPENAAYGEYSPVSAAPVPWA